MPVNPAALKQMLEIISPVRPKQVRMASGLGDLASTLRGGTQPAGQLLKQLAGRPGVKQGALSQVFGHIDPGTRLSPQDLRSQARLPKLFAQRGITDGQLPDDDQVMEIANDIIWGPEFREKRAELFVDELLTMASEGAIDKDDAYRLIDKYLANPSVFELERDVIDLIDAKGIGVQEIFFERGLMGDALRVAYPMVENQVSSTRNMKPAFQDYQRQRGLGEKGDAYFETVLRGTPSRARTDLRATDGVGNEHFTNPAQLGHVRGSIIPEGRVFAEELQSDPLEELGTAAVPELEGIYGKLGRMLIDRSAEARVPSVSFPDANRIASVRDQRQLPFFRDVYDKRLAKELYDPLTKRGVPLRQENGWTTMDLPEGVLEAIRKDKLLDYAGGGLVKGALESLHKATKTRSTEHLRNKFSGNGAEYSGRPFWSGTVDTRDMKINEVHPYSRAADADFHHSFYISPGQQDAMTDGDAAFFWVDPGRDPELAWREQLSKDLEEKLRRAIKQQTTPTASKLPK